MEENKGAAPQRAAPVPIDIILPVHGRPELTVKCVKALYGYTQVPFHLIVLDDTDASIKHGSFHQVDPADVTSPYFENLIKQKDNITYINRKIPYKCGNEFFNEGFKHCKHDYVATIMNSMTVEPHWETQALQIMEADPQVGVIGFKCLFPWGRIESAGIVFQGHIPCDFGRDEDGFRHPETMEVVAVQWAFAMIRKKAAVGNLQEDVFHGFVGWDDIDNCFAVRSKGWKILYCGSGVGIHQPRATRGSDTIEAHIKNVYNSHAFFKRWGFWEMFQEANKMDVSYKLKPETKEILTSIVLEFQVLQTLLNERQAQMKEMGSRACKELGVEPLKFTLEMNPLQNVWNLRPIAEKDGDNGKGKSLKKTKEVIKV